MFLFKQYYRYLFSKVFILLLSPCFWHSGLDEQISKLHRFLIAAWFLAKVKQKKSLLHLHSSRSTGVANKALASLQATWELRLLTFVNVWAGCSDFWLFWMQHEVDRLGQRECFVLKWNGKKEQESSQDKRQHH